MANVPDLRAPSEVIRARIGAHDLARLDRIAAFVRTSVVALALLASAGCADDLVTSGLTGSGLRGNGDVVTETRTVADFDELRAGNGIAVRLTVDTAAAQAAAPGEVELAARADSNLLEYVVTELDGPALRATIDGPSGGVSPTEGMQITATVGRLSSISADNGAVVDVIGLAGSLTLSANNGAVIDLAGTGSTFELDADNGVVVAAGGFAVDTAVVDIDNGAVVSVCVAGSVSGTADNGAVLNVDCGGDPSGVEATNGAVLG